MTGTRSSAYDHTPAGTIALLAMTLAVFAVDVPSILAFTVARYATDPGSPAAGSGRPTRG